MRGVNPRFWCKETEKQRRSILIFVFRHKSLRCSDQKTSNEQCRKNDSGTSGSRLRSEKQHEPTRDTSQIADQSNADLRNHLYQQTDSTESVMLANGAYAQTQCFQQEKPRDLNWTALAGQETLLSSRCVIQGMEGHRS